MALVTSACAGAGVPVASVTEADSVRDAPAVVPVVAPATETAINPPPEAMDGEVAVAEPPALLGSRPRGTAPGTWAVLIGVDNYPGSRYDLASAVNDARDVDAALAGMGVPGDHRLMLTDGQVTRTTIRSAVDWLVARAGPDAVAVFFYAGHVRKLAQGREAIVTADGRSFTDAELAAALAPLPARRAWIGIAACYGGGFTEVLRPGRVLTGAAGADQLAYENSEFGRSYMVQYMVREAMLQGKAPDSVQAAYAYADQALRATKPDRRPVQVDMAGAALDLRPPGATPPAPPPRPAAKSAGATTPTSTPPRTAGGGGSGSGSGSSGGSHDDDPDCSTVDSLFARC